MGVASRPNPGQEAAQGSGDDPADVGDEETGWKGWPPARGFRGRSPRPRAQARPFRRWPSPPPRDPVAPKHAEDEPRDGADPIPRAPGVDLGCGLLGRTRECHDCDQREHRQHFDGDRSDDDPADSESHSVTSPRVCCHPERSEGAMPGLPLRCAQGDTESACCGPAGAICTQCSLSSCQARPLRTQVWPQR